MVVSPLLCWLLGAAALPASAQPPTPAHAQLSAFLLAVPTQRNPPLVLRLRCYDGSRFAAHDSAQLTADGAYTLRGDTATRLCRLDLDRYSRTELVLGPHEAISFSATVPQLAQQGAYLEKSPENQAYFAMLALVQHYDTLIGQIHSTLLTLPDTAARQRSAAERYLERLHRNLNLQLRQQAAAPGTFAARVLAPLAATPERPATAAFAPGYLAWLREHYLDNLLLVGPLLLQHYLAIARLDYFVFTLGPTAARVAPATQALARRQALDHLLARRQGDDAVNAWLYQLLLAAALRRDDRALARHLALNYAATGCAPALPPALQAQLTQTAQLEPGQPAPELNLPDSAGVRHSLQAFAQQHRYTVLYGWVSWCHTCALEAPALAALQAQVGAGRLGVYAAALDETRPPWLAALRAKAPPAAWLQVAQLGPLAQNEAARAYLIRLTPRLALLDQQGRLVGLYTNVAELGTVLRAALSK